MTGALCNQPFISVHRPWVRSLHAFSHAEVMCFVLAASTQHSRHFVFAANTISMRVMKKILLWALTPLLFASAAVAGTVQNTNPNNGLSNWQCRGGIIQDISFPNWLRCIWTTFWNT